MKDRNPDIDMTADIGQDPLNRPRFSAGPSKGGVFGTQLQSAVNYNIKRKKLLSPWLMLRLHGWPEDAHIFHCGASHKDLQAWCGDGMHLAANGAFWIYCMSNIVKVGLIIGSPSAGPAEPQDPMIEETLAFGC